jgi:hypothetical protein
MEIKLDEIARSMAISSEIKRLGDHVSAKAQAVKSAGAAQLR